MAGFFGENRRGFFGALKALLFFGRGETPTPSRLPSTLRADTATRAPRAGHLASHTDSPALPFHCPSRASSRSHTAGRPRPPGRASAACMRMRARTRHAPSFLTRLALACRSRSALGSVPRLALACRPWYASVFLPRLALAHRRACSPAATSTQDALCVQLMVEFAPV